MLSGPEHFKRAETLLERAELAAGHNDEVNRQDYISRAKVHAKLAEVAAIVEGNRLSGIVHPDWKV